MTAPAPPNNQRRPIGALVERARAIPATQPLWFWLASLIFLALRLMTWLVNLPVKTIADAHSFLPGPTTSLPSGPIIGLEKVSLTGVDAIRPWPFTLFYGVQPVHEMRSLSQTLVSVVAFVIFAMAIRGKLTNRWLAAASVAITYLIGLSPFVTDWDTHIHRESLLISATILFIAVAISALGRTDPTSLVALAAIGTLLMVMRFTLAPVAISAFLFIAFVRLRQGQSKRWLAGFLVIAALGSVYAYAYARAHDKGWIKWYGQTISESQFGYIMHETNPGIDFLKAEVFDALPKCATEDLPVLESEGPSKPWYYVRDRREWCPELSTLIRSGSWDRIYFASALTSPSYNFHLIRGLAPHTLGWPDESVFSVDAIGVVPIAVLSAVMPQKTASGLVEPMFAWSALLVLLWAGLGQMHKWLQVKRVASRASGNRSPLLLFTIVIAASILSLLIANWFVPTADGLPFRVSVAQNVTLRLVIPLSVIVLLDKLAITGVLRGQNFRG